MKKNIISFLFIAFAHIFLLFKFQFTSWPEMFSFPYLINNDYLIYKDFHHAYQPLLTFILAGIYKIFGYDILVLKIFSWLTFIIIDLLVFIHLIKNKVGYIKSIFLMTIYIITQVLFEGNGIWYDSFVIPFILLSLFFLNKKIILSGLFLSLAILVKQQSGLLILPYIIYLYTSTRNVKDIGLFFIGGVVPVLLVFSYLIYNNIFFDYLFWTFQFPLLYLPKIQGYAQGMTIPQMIIVFTYILPLVFGYKKIISSKYNIFLVTILIVLFLTSYPRFSLLHMQPFIAIYILLLGQIFNSMILILPMFLFYLIYKSRFTFSLPDRFYSDKSIGVTNSKVYYLGPHGINYVKSNNLPPKPWIENYVWHFEIPELQDNVIAGWQVDPPTYIYWSKPENGNLYDLGTYQPKEIVKYIKSNYQQIEEIGNVGVWKLNR